MEPVFAILAVLFIDVEIGYLRSLWTKRRQAHGKISGVRVGGRHE
jgi:hypothetical protein